MGARQTRLYGGTRPLRVTGEGRDWKGPHRKRSGP
jgi:hypothetical protein